MHSKEYINDLVDVTIRRGLFKNVEDAMENTKALAICTGSSIDSIRKCRVPDIPKAYYNLVVAFYYLLLPLNHNSSGAVIISSEEFAELLIVQQK
jgi:hypothetical protein